MAGACQLLSIGLVEKDNNADSLFVWSYPSISGEQQEKFLHRCNVATEASPHIEFLYSQSERHWYYIYTTQVPLNCHSLPKVTFVSLVLVAKTFQPEQYKALCEVLSSVYMKSASPATMLQCYLNVVTNGECKTEDKMHFTAKDFDVRQAYAASNLRSVIQIFGVETILIYTAQLLKKSIVVYHPKISELLTFNRSLPALAWHRQDWGNLFPYITLDNTDIETDLKSRTSYIAGFTDALIQNRSDLYDLLVNLQTREISVSPGAKESLAMGKLHKDIAMFMVNCAEDTDCSEQQLIKKISEKTKELLTNLTSLSETDETGKSYITLELLRSRKMPKNTETFLYNLAVCEGLAKY
ncbi:DENN domain-containing protein 10 [Octopus bimaculoides]|uniref:UDENN domain-containing protein n=1 Tax=Octopus bimaculoides TaxID=37653 RepID=A0A0L8GJW2_OCTBM|nr:DENN domain-containing protein 10 [Octopus bimaculoides]|eukprot:XP_014780385.1 PREDICTED: protein FAM45A-like [Octopus bimaculoides]